MADIINELNDQLTILAGEIVREELDRAGIQGDDRESIEKEITDRVTQDLKRQVERGSKQIRDDVRYEIEGRLKARRKSEKKIAKPEGRVFMRFNRLFRFQHIVLFLSVIFLILTGMPQKFTLFDSVVDILGGKDVGVVRLRLLHRLAASGLIFFFSFHMIYNIFLKAGRHDFWLMLPRPKDILDVFQMVKYFLGVSKEKPRFDRFSYMEKFDYWAVYWGCVVMIGTGAVLWFNKITMQYMPKWTLDLAKLVHSDEALLATLALIIWHFYNVHFNPERFPGTLLWWHGRMSEEEMKREHPLEYERIIAHEKVTTATGMGTAPTEAQTKEEG